MTCAQQSGWAQLGEMLGGGVDRESAYLEGFREGLEREEVLQESQARRHIVWVRSKLAEMWQTAGFTRADATALATAYESTGSESAVISGIRRKGSNNAIADTGEALDSHNYLLANQLLLAYVIVAAEEQE
ncbi:MAG: hypothetical protein WDZ50_07450 [Woeseia sp.]